MGQTQTNEDDRRASLWRCMNEMDVKMLIEQNLFHDFSLFHLIDYFNCAKILFNKKQEKLFLIFCFFLVLFRFSFVFSSNF